MGGKRHVKKKKTPKPGLPPAADSATVVPPLAVPVAAPSTATIPAMPLFVFDRERISHPWTDVLELGGDSDANRRAIRENWRMDGRVDAGRETALLASPAFTDAPLSYADWQRQIETYFGQHSWNLDAPPNGRNRLRRGLSPAEGLLHVVSFARLVRYLQKRPGSTFEIDWTAAFPAVTSPLPDRRRPDPEYFEQGWVLAEELNRHGRPEVQRAAGFLADQLGPKEPPWWAGFAAELDPFLEAEDWMGLGRALGLGHLTAGEGLLVFRYTVNDVIRSGGGMYRPTVAEAAAHPYHFPSPESSPYGFTMPLAPGVYCRELVHPPLKGAAAAQACDRPLVRLASNVLEDYSRLPVLRAEQRLRLEKEWPDGATAAWLRRHAPTATP